MASLPERTHEVLGVLGIDRRWLAADGYCEPRSLTLFDNLPGPCVPPSGETAPPESVY